MLLSVGETTPRTQKITCLLGGSRRGRVRRLRIVGTRTDLWDWERVADGKTVCIDKNFFDQQSQDHLRNASLRCLRGSVVFRAVSLRRSISACISVPSSSKQAIWSHT